VLIRLPFLLIKKQKVFFKNSLDLDKNEPKLAVVCVWDAENFFISKAFSILQLCHGNNIQKLIGKQANCKDPQEKRNTLVNVVYTITVVNVFTEIHNFSQRWAILLRYFIQLLYFFFKLGNKVDRLMIIFRFLRH